MCQCGCVALLMSACKAENISYSPPHIQRALENTAKRIPNLSFPQQGWGLIQVDKAFEYLQACKDLDYYDVYYDVRVENKNNKSGNDTSSLPRGIYLRQKDETSIRQTFTINVNPQFPKDLDILESAQQQQRSKIDFEMKCNMKCDESWVTIPEHLLLTNNGRSFKVAVDPTGLPPGLHTAQVCGTDSDHPESGVVWYLPITITKPMDVERIVDLGELEVRQWRVNRCLLLYRDLLS